MKYWVVAVLIVTFLNIVELLFALRSKPYDVAITTSPWLLRMELAVQLVILLGGLAVLSSL